MTESGGNVGVVGFFTMGAAIFHLWGRRDVQGADGEGIVSFLMCSTFVYLYIPPPIRLYSV
ncbi:hypothetical protein CWI61_02195 [Neisseria meningitidis]|nr:hypothetical protein CWI61_02195 [Neisseria meningitidis]